MTLRFLPDPVGPLGRPKRARYDATGPLLFPPFAGLEAHGYSCLLIDPPWKHTTWSDKGITSRAPAHHYDVMTLPEIKALPVADLAGRDTHLFLWTTQPHLELSFQILKAWGFKYSSVAFTWVKLLRRYDNPDGLIRPRDVKRGTGYTTRKSTELVLLGRKGSPVRLSGNVDEVIFAPLREHSRKPDEQYPRIEAYCDGPRLELFGRQSRPGWTVWGDQATLFDPGDKADSLG